MWKSGQSCGRAALQRRVRRLENVGFSPGGRIRVLYHHFPDPVTQKSKEEGKWTEERRRQKKSGLKVVTLIATLNPVSQVLW